MNKTELKNILREGKNRGKNYLAIKIIEAESSEPFVTIFPMTIADAKVLRYLKATDDNLVFKDTGNKIEDVLATSNLSDITWFIY